jgi:hypothetical protein
MHRAVIVAAWTWDEEVDFLRAYTYRPYAYSRKTFHADSLGQEFTWFLLPEHVAMLRNRNDRIAP